MAKVCDLCGRGPTFSRSRSHSNIASKRRHDLNLHLRRIGNQRLKVCTKCLKTSAKTGK